MLASIFASVYLGACISMLASAHTCAIMQGCVLACIFDLCVCVCVYMFGCCMLVWMCACVFMTVLFAHACIYCVHACIFASMCVCWVHVFACLSVHVGMCVLACVHVHTCICACMHVCMCFSCRDAFKRQSFNIITQDLLFSLINFSSV